MTRRGIYPHALALFTQLVVEPAIKAPYLSTADWLRDFFSWPDERRREWQAARLGEVIAAAARDVPFYRERLGGGGSGVSLHDLPVVSKALIRPQVDRFLAEDWRNMRHISKRTGGTTGDPWQYPLDKRAWTQMYASSIHLFERTGYRYGDRVVLLGAPASLGLDEPGVKTRLRRRLERHDTSLAGYAVDRAASAERVARAGAVAAGLWYGFAGTIAAMADAVLEEGLSVRPPRAIVTTAEPLQPAWRDRITAAFGVRPFDQYGCNDGGVMSQTCARGRFHLAENLSIVEVLDDDAPAGRGVEGEVAVTNLHARVLPFCATRAAIAPSSVRGPVPAERRGRRSSASADDRWNASSSRTAHSSPACRS